MRRKRHWFIQKENFHLKFLPFLFNHLKMSQAEIARALGCSRQYISTALSSGRCTKLEEVFNLAHQLKLTDEAMMQIIMLYILTVRKQEHAGLPEDS